MNLLTKAGCVCLGPAREGQGWRGRGPCWLWCRARPINQETVLQHHFGILLEKLDSPLAVQPQGAHLPRNPLLPGCSQTRAAFKALIVNECCSVGQTPQACAGARGGQDVHLEARQAHGTIRAWRKQRENRAGERERRLLSTVLGWGATVNTGPENLRGRECQTQSKTCFLYLPRGTLFFSFFFRCFTIFSSSV